MLLHHNDQLFQMRTLRLLGFYRIRFYRSELLLFLGVRFEPDLHQFLPLVREYYLHHFYRIKQHSQLLQRVLSLHPESLYSLHQFLTLSQLADMWLDSQPKIRGHRKASDQQPSTPRHPILVQPAFL